MKQAILILGATSPIAKSACHEFARQGYPLVIAGRNLDEINRMANDINIRYNTEVKSLYFDAENTTSHKDFFSQANQLFEGLSGAILAFGVTGNHALSIRDYSLAHHILKINFLGAVSILTILAEYFEVKQKGFIISIGSVAGDRGRQSNYIYGSAKAGLDVYLQGLRNRLQPSGVRVITVKPGFVDTKMTFGKPGMFLVASPEKVGIKIAKSIHKRTDTLYLPWFWKPIMQLIRMIPEPIFKRLKL